MLKLLLIRGRGTRNSTFSSRTLTASCLLKQNMTRKKHFCMHCLQCFTSEAVLSCIVINGVQAIRMPEKGSTIKFQNYHKQLQAPFVIYVDFEAITEKVSGCTPNNNGSYTEAYQKHKYCSYAYKVVCCYDDQYTKPVQSYRGENAVNKLLYKMLDEVKYCRSFINYKFNKDLFVTFDEEDSFQKSTACHICGKEYNKSDKRVRDHCHVTGKYCRSAHEACNLNFKLTDKIPVLFHNLRGYDSHFIMQQIRHVFKTIS